MSQFILSQEIIKLSVSDKWDLAKLEWNLHEIYEAEIPQTCLCSHFPIKEVCVLKNKKNSDLVKVGNCCVKKFIGLPSDKIFSAVKRVRKDITRSLNIEAITHAHNKKWINDWERDFYIDIMRQRKLYPKQAFKKKQINEKMLRNMRRSRF